MPLFPQTRIDFMGLRRLAFLISGIVIAISLASLILKGGPKLGLDFTGGIEVCFKFNHSPSISQIRSGLARIGWGNAIIQRYGRSEENLVLIRYGMEEISQEMAARIVAYRKKEGKFTRLEQLKEIPGIEAVGYENLANLFTIDPSDKEKVNINQIEETSLASLLNQIIHKKTAAKIEEAVRKEEKEGLLIESINIIGPKVSKELRGKAVLAVTFALLGMLIYIAWRFEPIFSLGAVVALAHDVFISLGALSLGNFELTLPIIAALLTIIGYSLNDTIVIYDRIRENLKTYRKRKSSFKRLLNLSINQSLSRTIITSLTTFLVVLVLFLWGGAVLHGFTFALLVGIIVGTYSSSFVAAPVVYPWRKG